jgi:hypothetical protein
MREDIRAEIQRKIPESFEKARGPEPQPVRKMSEEQRAARTAGYADLFSKGAKRKLEVGSGSV